MTTNHVRLGNMGKEQRTRNKEQTTKNSIGKLFVLSLVIGCWSLAVFAGTADASVFLRDLKLGDRGEDVRQLQIVLNKNSQTQVSYSGIGAPGQETDYFGLKTEAAVRRYQNLNASKILTPLGLTSGTGYVGASTRTQLNGGSVASVAPQNTTVSFATPRQPLPMIPRTEEELTTSFENFSQENVDDEENVREFARTMVLASQGFSYTPTTATSTNQSQTTAPQSTSSGSGNTSSTMSGGSSGSGSSQQSTDVNVDAGCIGLIFSLLGL